MFTHAILRRPGADCADGITTGPGRPDPALMQAQHTAYLDALRGIGLATEVLEPLPGHPDAYFVEDVAVVMPELAVLARPGAEARRGEVESMVPVLARHRPVVRIEAPGTLDGGDVLMVGRHFFVGLSRRTNLAGARALGAALERHGCTWAPVPVAEGLHLKSSVTWLGEGTLLITRALAHRPEFAGYRRILVDPGEAYACNVVWVNGHLLAAAGFPNTLAQLQGLGLPIHALDCSEARKMDGALTCLSLRF